MKVQTIHFEHLRSEAHCKFLFVVKRLLENYPAVAAIVTALLSPLYQLIALEEQLVDAVKKSPLTKKIAEADSHIDRDIVGITAAVNSALHHFNSAIVEAAELIDIRLKSFRGSIEKKSYEEESLAVGILISDLMTVYRSQVTLLGLNDWVTDLEAVHNEFDALLATRNHEETQKPQGELRDVRKQTEALYRQVIVKIESYANINGDNVVLPFVLDLNKEVAYFNEHIHHQAKKDIGKAAVKAIPEQIYAGKPVIVMPEVFDDGKELVFTKDYELSYSQNNAPGTAAVIIHGKGAYKGTKNISFNIVAHA
jgi:hypothetical protein